MQLNTYKQLPYPQNLWSTVFEKTVDAEEIPGDWEESLMYLLGTLKGKQDKEVVQYYFIDRLTWRGIADIYGFSRQRTQQICQRVVRKLQKPARKQIMLYGLKKIESMRKEQEEVNRRIAATLTMEDLGLSIRSFNCLLQAHIDTVEVLVQCTEADLLKLSMFGRVSLMDIKQCLGRYGLSLYGELPTVGKCSQKQ